MIKLMIDLTMHTMTMNTACAGMHPWQTCCCNLQGLEILFCSDRQNAHYILPEYYITYHQVDESSRRALLSKYFVNNLIGETHLTHLFNSEPNEHCCGTA